MINWYKDLPNIKPKYLAITRLIRRLVQEDQLLPGQRLPSERQLAELLQVDRSTVNRALAELSDAGFIVKRVGSGTYIADFPQENSQHKINWATYAKHEANDTTQALQDKISNARTTDLGDLLDGASNNLPIDLIPELGSLQIDWQNFLVAQKQEDESGYLPLIQEIEKIHAQKQQFQTDNQTTVITGGAQQSLLLILLGLLNIGDAVAFPTPSYFHSSSIFKNAGIRTFPIPTDNNGLDLKYLESIILKHRIKLLIVNPTFQNPTGQIMTLEQRQRTLELCQTYQIPIVEDDVFGWLVKKAAAVPTFKKLAPENVIYLSSLSKLLGSSTRIGWIVAPQAISQQLLQAQKKLDIVPSLLAQAVAYLALNNDQFQKEIEQLIINLDNRRQSMMDLLHQVQPTWQFSAPQGGFYLWIKQDQMDIFEILLKKKLLIKSGVVYGASKKEFRLNFANFDYDKRQRLAKILKKL